ncbi:hypothetical protein LUZ60_012804 [Juncus effusus]|nr:hypothetical protein LUZ60_012804 [Juncus effusus]
MFNLHKRHSPPMVEITSHDVPSHPEGSVSITIDNLEAAARSRVQKENSDWAVKNVSINMVERSGAKSVNNLQAMRATMKSKNDETEKKNIIIRCPAILVENNFLYQPRVVSIGPHHRGLTSVQNLENLKWSSLNNIAQSDKSLGLYIKCIEDLEKEVRGCYQRNIGLSSNEFVQILLLDSMFIITTIFADATTEDKMLHWPLFSDLLLVENQIPFFVIEKLWDKVAKKIKGGEHYPNITSLLRDTPFWKKGFSTDSPVVDETLPADIPVVDETKHLLDLYYKWNVLPTSRRLSNPPRCLWLLPCCICGSKTEGDENTTIPSATELYEDGVKFRKAKSLNMFDLSFANGTLEIPTLVLESEKMSLIVNLLSHELGDPKSKRIVLSYVFFMDSLINTKKDIALLQKLGVINNKLPSNEDAARFFNSLGDSCAPTKVNAAHNFYAPVIKDMMSYSNSCWRNQWTSLKHNYFNSPWTIISLVAGGALLFLAFVQTYFTVWPRK